MASDNIKLAQQLAQAHKQILDIIDKQKSSMQGQLKIMEELHALVAGKGLDKIIKDTESLEKNLGNINKTLKDSGESKQSINEMIDSLGNAEKTSDQFGKSVTDTFKNKFPIATAVAAASLDGLRAGFKNTMAITQQLYKVFQTVTKGAWQITKAIVAIPLSIISGLIQKAQAGGGGTELAEAYEKVRATFGSFKEDVSKNVIAGAKSMEGELANTGLSVWRIFGNMAERLNYFREIAESMGPTFHKFGAEIAANAEVFGAYQKGLGIAKEELAGVAENAISFGKNVNEVFRETANYSLQLGADFGISQKVIAKDIGAMMKDVKSFGNLSVKEFAEISIYTRKLGVDIKKLLGIVDKFDTFEDAATNAAKLGQAFGVTIDAFQMMQEQNPAKRIDMLKNSFAAAGKSAENMSRQELKLLSQQTGLDEATARLVFSSQNQGKSYDEIAKKSGLAEKKQLSQEEAMSKLADSIERLVKSGGTQFKSFWGAFVQGFKDGLERTGEFWGMMRNINLSLKQVYQIGIKTGQIFAKVFPGVQEMMKGFSDLFEPKKWTTLYNGISSIFLKLSKGEITAGQALDSLKDIAKDFFGSQKGALGGIKEGFLKFTAGMGNIIAGIIKYLGEKLPDVINFISDVISGKKKIGGAGFGQTRQSEGEKQFSGMIDNLIESFKEAGPPIGAALSDLGKVVLKKIKEFASKHKEEISKVGLTIVGFLFGPAFTQGLVTKLGGIAIEKLLTKGLGTGAASAGTSVGGSFTAGLGGALGTVAVVAAIAVAAVGVSNGIDKYKKDLTKKFDDTSSTLGAAAGGIVDTITFGMLPPGTGKKIAEQVATLSTMFFDKLKEYFGPGISNGIKKIIGADLDIIGALGGVIKAAVGADSKGLGVAFDKLGEKLLDGMSASLKFMFIELPPRALGYLMKYGGALVSGLVKGLSSLLKKIGDKLPFVSGLLKPITMTLDFFGEAIDGIRIIGKNLTDWLESVDLSALVTENIVDPIMFVWNSINDVFKKIKKLFSSFGSSIIDSISGALDSIYETMSDFWTDDIEPMFTIKYWEDMGKNIIDGITNGLKNLGDALVKPFKEGGKAIKDFFGIKSPSKWFEDMGGNMAEGVAIGLDDLPKKMETKAKKSSEAFSTSFSPKVGMGTQAITPALKAAQDMIAKANELNSALSDDKINKFKIVPQLSKLAEAVGIGSKESFTIKNKDFVINLNMEVVMKADELEKVMIQRKDSVIRENLNAANYTNKPASNPIPDRYP